MPGVDALCIDSACSRASCDDIPLLSPPSRERPSSGAGDRIVTLWSYPVTLRLCIADLYGKSGRLDGDPAAGP
ncbi:hypothetical protein GCM10022205_10950 [Spinactinospora alkalitolerans]